MVLSIYNYSVECIYVESSTNTEYRIISESIESIISSNNYFKSFMPILGFKVNLESSIYNRMIKDQGEGYITLNIQKYSVSGTSTAKVSHIFDKFQYIMTNKPNPNEELDKYAYTSHITYRTCFIGLIKKQSIDQLKRSFNGIYKDTTIATMVLEALGHMTGTTEFVIEQFKYDIPISSMSVPLTPSIPKYLELLNSKSNFYGMPYLFFIDFNKTYLKSISGKYIADKSDQFPYIAIDIRNMDNYQSMSTGMVIDDSQQAYIIYTNKDDINFNIDRVTPQLNANIGSIDSNGNLTQYAIDTSAITHMESNENSSSYIRSNDPNIAEFISNSLVNNSVKLRFTKHDMDSTVFTPNKEYLVSNYEGQPELCGRYYLANKSEIFINRGSYFSSSMTVELNLAVAYNMNKSNEQIKQGQVIL